MQDNEFNDEVNNLIEWCEDLDYEKYIGNWHKLATSAYIGAPDKQYPTDYQASAYGGEFA